ncbi:MAG: potassium transporter [Gemmatimonadales bacterium]|nr:MAG: potassium transporter [Gemmatimonadales bacterium]
MTALTLLLAAAALGHAISRWSGLPTVPVLILAGVITTAIFPVEPGFLQDALVLGLTVLVFTAGIELNPGRVRHWRRAAILVGAFQFVILGVIGVGGGFLLGIDLESALYLGLALSASSTLVVVRLLQQRQQLFESIGRLVTGVLLLQDLLVILMIPVLSRFGEGAGAIAAGVGGTLALTLLAAVMIRWGAAFIVQRLAFDEESMLLVVLGILFVFLGLSWALGLPMVTGAFLAGVALSSFPVNLLVRGQLSSLSDFFNALFFTALGAFLPLPSGAEWIRGLLLAGAVIVVTPPLVAWLAERAGFSARPALGAGLLLAQTSEFSLVVALLGVSTGQLPQGLLTVIALVTVLTMVATPFLATDRVTLALMRIHPSRRRPAAEAPPSNHILLLGCGRNGMSLLEELIVSPHHVIVVDDDPALVDQLADAGVEVIRGDISDPRTLEAAGALGARVVISTIRRVADNGALLDLAREGPTLVRSFHDEDAERIRAAGGTPIQYSEAAASEVLTWLEEAPPG